ncbi:phosphoribosyltransferase [Actinoplanes sp. NPDC020271]|uniref:phosphoribosyltransferase n=1 Tax=Actinoplanes sp. NPDC020271 TaxID=3363896 RepID=UPI00378967B7
MFHDRVEAGRRLGRALADRRGTGVVVLGLSPGGIMVAREVSRALDAVLDVIVVRTVGAPQEAELAMGAVGENSAAVVDPHVAGRHRLGPRALAVGRTHLWTELERAVHSLRGDLPPVVLCGRRVVLVDDGAATGTTARAACEVARALGAGEVILASPVAAPAVVEDLAEVADEVVFLHSLPAGEETADHYDDFRPPGDHEVTGTLRSAAAERAGHPEPAWARERDAPGVARRAVVPL